MINTLLSRFGRPIAAALVLLIASQMSQAVVLPIQEPQQTAPAQQAQPAAPQTVTIAASSSSLDGLPQAPEPAVQQTQQQGDQDAQKPVGTAAGPVTRPGGVAGSRPSGAVIAPAKQRRVKALFIRYTLIVAGVAATGAVIGLSKASPSHPQ